MITWVTLGDNMVFSLCGGLIAEGGGWGGGGGECVG